MLKGLLLNGKRTRHSIQEPCAIVVADIAGDSAVRALRTLAYGGHSVQSVSFRVSPGQGLRSRLILFIHESFRDDVIRTPSKMNGPAFPGAQEWNASSLNWCEGVGRSRSRHPLADQYGPGLGPVIEHRRVRGLAAVVGDSLQTSTMMRDIFSYIEPIKDLGDEVFRFTWFAQPNDD